jgi:DNA-3-methyladenine glycosylase
VPLQDAPEHREQARLTALLRSPAAEAARSLIGHVLVRPGWGEVRIVETEAYLGAGDPAAHAFRGRTPRTEPLWGPPGTFYVYLIYGLHHCLNLAVDGPLVQGCVLIRAAEPVGDTDLPPDACRGPGRLCRALHIDLSLSGRHVFENDAPLTLRAGTSPDRVAVSPRVGIRQAAERPLRFFDPTSPAVSRRPGGGVISGLARPGAPAAVRPRARRDDP